MLPLKFHHESVLGYIQEDTDWALKSPEHARQGWPSHSRDTALYLYRTINSSFVIGTGNLLEG